MKDPTSTTVRRTVRPATGRTGRETAVIHAAMQAVADDPGRDPRLTRAVKALHAERDRFLNPEEFYDRMLNMPCGNRSASALHRSGIAVEDLVTKLSAREVTCIRNSGMRSWATWYLTCLEFGIEPPWAAEMLAQHWFREQVQFERDLVAQALAGARR